MQYTYYFLLYAIEVIKFYIIYKNYYGFPERIKGKKEWIILIAGIAIMAFIMKDSNLCISPLFVYVLFIFLEGNFLFKVPLLKFLIYSSLTMEVIGTLDAMSTILIETIMGLIGQSDFEFQKIFVFGFTFLFIYGVGKLLSRKNKIYENRIPFIYIVLFMVIGVGNSIILGLFQNVVETYGKDIYKVVFLFVTIGMFLEMAMILVLAELNEVYKEKNNLNKEYLTLQNEHYAYLEKGSTKLKNLGMILEIIY